MRNLWSGHLSRNCRGVGDFFVLGNSTWDEYEWTGNSTDWQFQCYPCHFKTPPPMKLYSLLILEVELT